MPCRHKFSDDLYIKYAKDWNPTTLIVGTFNPEWPEKNYAQWFYGRTENNLFWTVLPCVYNQQSLICSNKENWLIFCKENKIALTDLISCIKTADVSDKDHYSKIASYSDASIAKHFSKNEDLELVNIVRILQENSSIKHVYLTRGANSGLWKKLWKPVREYCIQNGINVNELLTPSSYARYQYKSEFRMEFDTLSSFIISKWKDKWHKN